MATEFYTIYFPLPPVRLKTQVDQEAAKVIDKFGLDRTNALHPEARSQPEDLYLCYLMPEEGVQIVRPYVDEYGRPVLPIVGDSRYLSPNKNGGLELAVVLFRYSFEHQSKLAPQQVTLTATLALKYPPRQTLGLIHMLSTTGQMNEVKEAELASFCLKGNLLETPI